MPPAVALFASMGSIMTLAPVEPVAIDAWVGNSALALAWTQYLRTHIGCFPGCIVLLFVVTYDSVLLRGKER